MSRTKFMLLGIAIIIIICVVIVYQYFSTANKSDVSISGWFFGHQAWSGNIYITGDVEILGNLTVLPGTKVKFAVGDDRHRGDEVPPDGFNNQDPTRLEQYSATHSSLFVLNKLVANGMPAQPIVFTSAAPIPDLADWEAIIFRGDGSIINHVIVEYTRNGLNPTGKQSNSIIQNSVSRHAMWGAISAANSNIKIINNHLSDAGHEGIDLKSDGNQEVIGNVIEDCHTGIAAMAGSQLIKDNTITDCGDGVYIDDNSSALSIDNTFVPAPAESQRVWRYGDYTIPVFGMPAI